MTVRTKVKETEADGQVAAGSTTEAVNPSAHEMVSTVMREKDLPAKKNETTAEPAEEQDVQRAEGKSLRRTRPLGIAAGRVRWILQACILACRMTREECGQQAGLPTSRRTAEACARCVLACSQLQSVLATSL